MPTEREERQIVGCWFCSERFEVRRILADGILRSRTESAGGPYRLFVCPSCGRENVCERTRKGHWFASPNVRVSILDYFFSHFVDTGTAAEDLLAAAAWHEEHDERRRYHFEKDRDYRYSGRSFFKLLRPAGRKPDPAARRARARVEPRLDDGPPPPRARPAPAHRIPAPEEVLGLRIGASDREVRAAFHRLAVQYHPDKVRHLGEEFERLAGEKFLALKEAYEKLITRREARGRT